MIDSTALGNLSQELSQDLNLSGSDNISYGESHLSKVIYFLDLYINFVLLSILIVFSMGANIVNMMVLVKQGVTSCVSVCLFSISATDFLSTLSGFTGMPPKILMTLHMRPGFDPTAIYYMLAYLAYIFSDISNTLTAFLSLERCLCVSLPLQFKEIFTTKRTVMVIVCIYLVCFGSMMPHFLSSGFVFRTSGNSTYLALWLSPDRATVDVYIDIRNFIQTTLILGVVLVCTSLMLISLQRSSKFNKASAKESEPSTRSTDLSQRTSTELRNMPRAGGKGGEEKGKPGTEIKERKTPSKDQHTIEDSEPDGQIRNDNKARKQNKNSKLSRNRKVIKTVVMLGVFCFACNLPRVAASAAIFLEPRLKVGREYYKWYQLMISINYVFQLSNYSLNIFVYYRYNQSFRETLRHLFGLKTNT
ncbi:chemosensory receptor C [Elysia marginata]|uniref:Chemosensory receptor C n=1 Tax=Elysia marginata TaxID=1093978 RepID=A0AAV4IJ89_9GAST|nr:chemosensory receptor C [Elysia marginata]